VNSYVMRSKIRQATGHLQFDPGLVELRATIVTMAAVWASFGVAWLIEDLAHLHTDVVVLAVVLAVTLGRTQRDAHLRGRLISVGLLPIAAGCASEVGLAMNDHTVLGDTLFTGAIAASIWIRRFGPAFARAGTQAALPFIAILVSPVPPHSPSSHTLWVGLMAVIAATWVTVFQLIAQRTAIVPRPAATPSPAPTAPASAPTHARAGTARLSVSTRMSVQMGVALGGAFLVGHRFYPDHWTWAVLTAYIVASGNRGRGDVLHKSGLRVVGAAAGTVIATLLAGDFTAGDKRAVVAIFAVLTVATWLRSLSYAYWAGSVTAALAFLNGYFGESGSGLLRTRLEGILYGAAVALVAAWWILPIRTGDVLRRRVAEALAVLTDYLAALRSDPGQAGHHQKRFDDALTRLEQIAAPLSAHRFLTRGWRGGTHRADTITALRDCRRPMHDLTRAAADPGVLHDPAFAKSVTTLLSEVVAVRRAMAARSGTRPRNAARIAPPPPTSPPPGSIAEFRTAVVRITDATHATLT
jgi:hypothetical protein